MHSSLTTRLSLPDCDFEISIINCIVRGRAGLTEIADSSPYAVAK